MRKITGILCMMIVLSTTVVFAQTTEGKMAWGTYPPQSAALAQTIEGKMAVTGFPRNGVIKEVLPGDLFLSFKEGNYKISFSYKAEGMGSRGIVLFDMKTTVKRDGKIIHTSIRKGWPWLPGDMFVPIEAFDVIPALQKHVGDEPVSSLHDPKAERPLPIGKYEIMLEMVPVPTWLGDMQKEIVPKGKIAPATFSFNVTN